MVPPFFIGLLLMSMSPSRPYMVRALYQWILDNDCTPHILVNAMADGVSVPQQFVKDGQIVLNISPSAVRDLLIENEGIYFNGRFGGVPMQIEVPIQAVMGIYTRENGQGMMFEAEVFPEPPAPQAPETGQSSSKRPGLKVVK